MYKFFLSLVIVIVVLVIIQLSYDIPRTYFLLRNTSGLIAGAKPFSRTIPSALSTGPASGISSSLSSAPMRILVLGDSTAVGTGSLRPEDSTAGRLAALYPNAEIVNLAQNGLKISGLLNMLNASPDSKDVTNPKISNQYFDIVLIQIGANDIIRLTPTHDIDSGIAQVLMKAQDFTNKSSAGGKSGKVILLYGGNIGDAPLFPWYLRPLYSYRSQEVNDIYKKEAPAHSAVYVDLIDSPVTPTFKANPAQYYADDFLHFNDAGYGLWFAEIKKAL